MKESLNAWGRKAKNRGGFWDLNPTGKPSYKPNGPAIPKKAAFLFLLGVLLTAWVSVAFAGSLGESTPALSVHPAEAYTGDAIEITLSGLPPGYRLPGGAVTLAGLRLRVPGVFGVPGTQPAADREGGITFITRVPATLHSGPRPWWWQTTWAGKIACPH